MNYCAIQIVWLLVATVVVALQAASVPQNNGVRYYVPQKSVAKPVPSKQVARPIPPKLVARPVPQKGVVNAKPVPSKIVAKPVPRQLVANAKNVPPRPNVVAQRQFAKSAAANFNVGTRAGSLHPSAIFAAVPAVGGVGAAIPGKCHSTASMSSSIADTLIE